MMRTTNKENTLSINENCLTIVAVTVMLGSVFARFGATKEYSYIMLLGVLSISFMIFYRLRANLKKRLILVLLVSVFLWAIKSSFIILRNDKLPPFLPLDFVNIIVGLLMAFYFVYYPVNLKYLKLLYYSCVTYFLFLFIIMGEIDISSITEKASGVSVITITIALIVPILYLEYRNLNRISFLPVFSQWVLSLFVLSRAGFIACTMLLCFVLYFGTMSIKNSFFRNTVFLILFFVFAITVYYLFDNEANLGVISKFHERGSDLYGRDMIWNMYFKDFGFQDILIGRAIIGVNEGAWQNAHNSWIQLHSSLGIVGILFILIGIRLFYYFFRNELLYALIMLVLVVYSFLNMVFFHTVQDWCVYIFFFEYLRIQHIPKFHKHELRLCLF